MKSILSKLALAGLLVISAAAGTVSIASAQLAPAGARAATIIDRSAEPAGVEQVQYVIITSVDGMESAAGLAVMIVLMTAVTTGATTVIFAITGIIAVTATIIATTAAPRSISASSHPIATSNRAMPGHATRHRAPVAMRPTTSTGATTVTARIAGRTTPSSRTTVRAVSATRRSGEIFALMIKGRTAHAVRPFSCCARIGLAQDEGGCLAADTAATQAQSCLIPAGGKIGNCIASAC